MAPFACPGADPKNTQIQIREKTPENMMVMLDAVMLDSYVMKTVLCKSYVDSTRTVRSCFRNDRKLRKFQSKVKVLVADRRSRLFLPFDRGQKTSI